MGGVDNSATSHCACRPWPLLTCCRAEWRGCLTTPAAAVDRANKRMLSRALRNFVHCCAAVIGVVGPYLYVLN